MQTCHHQVVKIIFLFFIFWTIGSSGLWALTKASIVICAETGVVHHENNADTLTPPASLTKMMTLYLTFKALRDKRLKYDQAIPVSKHASVQAPCKLWLKPGSTITVKQAILGVVTKSANDAAVVLAETLGKTESNFANIMTQQARKLGMSKTVFKNVSGLPHKQQLTTAREMAILSRALYKHFPEFFPLFNTLKFAYKGQVYKNHNHLLGKVPGVDGIKTGFTNASGFNLSATMIRDNRRIIAVVLGGESSKARDKKTAHLLEKTHAWLKGNRGFQNIKEYASIDDLIYALGPSEAPTISQPAKKGKLCKAVYLSSAGKIKPLEAKYTSVDNLLDFIDETEPLPQKNIHKKPKNKKEAPKKKIKGKIKVVAQNKPSKKISPKKTVVKKPLPKKQSKKKNRSSTQVNKKRKTS